MLCHQRVDLADGAFARRQRAALSQSALGASRVAGRAGHCTELKPEATPGGTRVVVGPRSYGGKATMSGVAFVSSKPTSDPASILFKSAFPRHVPFTFSMSPLPPCHPFAPAVTRPTT